MCPRDLPEVCPGDLPEAGTHSLTWAKPGDSLQILPIPPRTPVRCAVITDQIVRRQQRSSRPARRDRRPETRRIAAPEKLEQRFALTVGLTVNNAAQAAAGYTLFGNSFSPKTYLIDNAGKEVHSWTSTGGQTSSYLLDNGNLLRNTIVPAGQRAFGHNGSTGLIEEFAWDGTRVWSFQMTTDTFQLHHDAIPMPNGNVLAIAWERHSAAEAIAMGRNPDLLNPATNREVWSEAIFEIQPDRTDGEGGEIVWEWHLKDHLVQQRYPDKPNYGIVSANPQLVHLNYVPRFMPGADTHIADWAHFNSIAYNAALDQIIVSAREFSEVWVIDHSTTTEQAAGHTGGRWGKGGDLLWRFGNPASWNGGTRANQALYFQHNAHWIESGKPGAGNILVFNNGWFRADGRSFSSVMEIRPAGYGRAQLVWNYFAAQPTSFFAPIVSGAQRLANGNTLITEGTTGRLFEVTRTRTLVWQYVNPVTAQGPLTRSATPANIAIRGLNGVPNVFANLTFRSLRFAPSFAGFTGKSLVAGTAIERT